MVNKIYKKVNKYNNGGLKKAGQFLSDKGSGVASALSGAASLISDVKGALAGNQEAINNAKAGINQVNSTTFNAGNTSNLMSQWSSANYMDPVTSSQLRSDKGALGVLSGAATGVSAGASLGPVGAIGGAIAGIGAGLAGWIGGKNKARKRAKKLNSQIADANERMDNNFESAVETLEQEQLNNALMNYAAFGGELDIMNEFKDGGIYIKPSKRGTFTNAAKKRGLDVQEFAAKVLANKEDYSPTMVKKANFARNASKWHAEGGPLESNGVIWPSDLMFINNGGTHEENPNEGIQIGVDNKGVPNLVEEGEVIYGDYVFSNRLKVPKNTRKELKLGNKEISFAEAVEKLSKESSERPNDYISEMGLRANLDRLIPIQEALRENKRTGNKFNNGGNKYSPYKTFYSDRDRSKWFTVDNTNPDKVSSYTDEYKNIDFTVDDAIAWAKANSNDASLKDFYAKGNTLENLTQDYVSNKSLDHKYGWLHEARAAKTSAINPDEPEVNIGDIDNIIINDSIPLIDDNVKLNSDVPLGVTVRETPRENNWQALLRYAPIVGNALGLLSNKADYSSADALSRNIDNIGTVGFSPLGDYLTYNPFDINYQANKIAAQSAATRRNILNTNYGNRGMANAALLASDLNSQIAMGDAYRQAAEYNQAQKERVANFNRGTNQFNTQMGLQVDMANANIQQAKLNARMKELAMRDAERRSTAAAKSANLTSLFDNLGNIGVDALNRADRDMIIKSGAYGTLSQKPSDWSNEKWERYKKSHIRACGGKLKRRKNNKI